MEVATQPAEIPTKLDSNAPKKTVLQRINQHRKKITLAMTLVIAGYYSAASNTKTPHKTFTDGRAVLTAINEALEQTIDWQVVGYNHHEEIPNTVHVTINCQETTEQAATTESMTENVRTCVDWVLTEGPSWAYNYQNTDAPSDVKNCNCKAAEVHAKLHAAGIPSVTISAEPKGRSAIANSWHQFVVVKLDEDVFLVFDENVGETIFYGSIEEFLSIQSPPMQLATIGPFNLGASVYGESTFNTAVSRLVRTWHNSEDMANVAPIINAEPLERLTAATNNHTFK